MPFVDIYCYILIFLVIGVTIPAGGRSANMNVSLTPELEALVHEQVQSGQYSSASEVIRDALRMFNQRQRDRLAKLEDLRREIQIGIDQVERGEVKPLDIEYIKREGRRRMGIR
jgi:antitoxin ParD1/3/4